MQPGDCSLNRFLLASVKSFYQVIINQLRVRVTRVQFIMVIATLTGFVSGLIAVLLKILVHYVQHWVKEIPVSRFAYLLFPGLGLLITVFIIRHFFGKEIEKGIAMVLKAIARKVQDAYPDTVIQDLQLLLQKQ